MNQLPENASAAFMLDASERHARLCRQTPNAAKYATAIEPLFKDLQSKNEIRVSAVKATLFEDDKVSLNDWGLDDILRKLHNRSQEYDSANPGAKTCTQLFPEGKLTPVIVMSDEKEVDMASLMAKKIEVLGSWHPLFPFVAEINQQVNECTASLKAYADSVKARAIAWADEDIAKFALRRQYTNNYHNAAADYDKNFAEKLFPKLRVAPKKDDDTSATTPSAS